MEARLRSHSTRFGSSAWQRRQKVNQSITLILPSRFPRDPSHTKFVPPETCDLAPETEGEWSPTLPCHTVQAGPAYGGSEGYAKPADSRGRPSESKKNRGQRVVQSGAVRQVPGTIGAARGLSCQLCTDAPPNEFPIPSSAAFPLGPDHGSQTMPYPFLHGSKQVWGSGRSRSNSSSLASRLPVLGSSAPD
jgi:hypothetical protein